MPLDATSFPIGSIRFDYGPEYIAGVYQAWLTKVGIKPISIYPVAPGRTVTTNALMAHHVEKLSMWSGSVPSITQESS